MATIKIIQLIQAIYPNNGLQLIAIHFDWNLYQQLELFVDHVLQDHVVLAWNVALLVLMDYPPLHNIFVSSKIAKNHIQDRLIYEIIWKHIKINPI